MFLLAANSYILSSIRACYSILSNSFTETVGEISSAASKYFRYFKFQLVNNVRGGGELRKGKTRR